MKEGTEKPCTVTNVCCLAHEQYLATRRKIFILMGKCSQAMLHGTSKYPNCKAKVMEFATNFFQLVANKWFATFIHVRVLQSNAVFFSTEKCALYLKKYNFVFVS